MLLLVSLSLFLAILSFLVLDCCTTDRSIDLSHALAPPPSSLSIFSVVTAGLRSAGDNRAGRSQALAAAGEGSPEVVATSAAAEARGHGAAAGQSCAHAGSLSGKVLPVSHRRCGPQLLRVL